MLFPPQIWHFFGKSWPPPYNVATLMEVDQYFWTRGREPLGFSHGKPTVAFFLFWKSDPQFSLILIGRCNLNRHLSLLQSFAKFLGRGNCDHASRNQIIMLEGGAQTNTKIRMHVYIMFNMGVQRRDGHRNCKQKMLWNNVPIYYTHHCVSI